MNHGEVDNEERNEEAQTELQSKEQIEDKEKEWKSNREGDFEKRRKEVDEEGE